MKVSLHRESALPAFALAASVAPSSAPKEVLTQVLLTATTDDVTLTATDYEMWIKVDLPGAEVDEPGQVLLPTRVVGSILRENPDLNLKLAVSKGGLTVAGKSSQYTLPTIDPEEFPPWETKDEGGHYQLSCAILARVLERTSFASDDEASSYALGGILLDIEAGGKLTAVGTDGRRMAVCHGTAEPVGEPGAKVGHIIPRRATSRLVSLLRDQEGNARLTLTPNHCKVVTANFTFQCRLLEGRFPDWKRAMKAIAGHEIPVNVGPLTKAIRQAAIAVSKESLGLEFTFEDGEVRLEARSTDSGQSKVELPLAFNGDEITTHLNYKYLLDALKLFDDASELSLKVESGDQQVQLVDSDGWKYIVMPLAPLASA